MISKIDFSEKNLTSNSGTLMLYNHTDAEGIFEMIDEEVKFHNPSINKIKMNHIKSLFCGFFIGIDKLERMRLLYNDPLVMEMAVDVKSPETISRFLRNFDYRTTHQLRTVSFKVFNHMLSKSRLLKITIDIDSSVINVEGHQEGTAKGYNPKKKGNKCYNVQFAFCDELKAYISGFVRSGNAHSANGASELIKEIYENIYFEGLEICFRMDSGYFDEEIIKTIESLGCKYMIKAKAYTTLISKVPSDEYFEKGSEGRVTSEMFTKLDKWHDNRRFIVSRVLKESSESDQITLFEKEYRYFFFVTNDDSLSSEEVVLFYEKRGNCENYIKESKYDMNVGNLILHSFWANEAIFQLMMLTYNIFLLFKMSYMTAKEYRQQIKTFRLKYVFLAGKIISTARYKILKLPKQYPYKGIYIRALS